MCLAKPAVDVSVLAALVGDDPATLANFLQDFWRNAQWVGTSQISMTRMAVIAL